LVHNTDKVTTRNTTAYFFSPLCIPRAKIGLCDVTDRATVTTGRRRLLGLFWCTQKGTMVNITAYVPTARLFIPSSQISNLIPSSHIQSSVLRIVPYVGYCENTQRCDISRCTFTQCARMSNSRINCIKT